MPALDIDPSILRTTAAASAHVYAQSIWHISEEIKADPETDMRELYDTLTEEGPYAYMVYPQVCDDGTVLLPVITTREQIAEAYQMIRGHSDLVEVIGLTEIRGTWYTFQDNISKARERARRAHDPHDGDPRPVPVGWGLGHHRRAGVDPLPGRGARRSRRAQHHSRRPAVRAAARLRQLRRVPGRTARQRRRRGDGGAPRRHLVDGARLRGGHRHHHRPQGRGGAPRRTTRSSSPSTTCRPST